MRKIIKYLTVLSLLFSTAEASVIGISIHDTTVAHGEILLLPVYVDSSLTDQNVMSFQLQLSFSGSILTVDSVISDGTLSQSFGSPNFNKANPNQLSIAAAGTSPLTGTGVLVYVRFRAVGAGYAGVAFSDAAHNFLNEGTPAVTLQSGTVYVQPAPSISVSPNTALLTVSDSLLFGGYGGTAPYRWAVTNGAVASIDSTGWLKALHHGFTRVIATDNVGVIDTSGIVEIRAFRLSIHDTSMLQGRTFDLPVYTTDLTGLNVTSGSMQITFNSSILTPVSVTQSGSLLAAYSPVVFNTKTPGQMNISFAGASPLEGKGVLFFVRFVVSPTNGGGTSVSLSSALFNEDLPGNMSDGNLSIIVPPPIYVSPSTATLVVGDTMRFYASNGTSPYVWLTTDTTIAQVDSEGLVSARRGGRVRVLARDFLGSTGTTNDIVVYDALVSIREITGRGPGTIDVPIVVDRLSSSDSVLSVQIGIVYDTTIVRAVGVVTTGTLIEGWSNTVNLTGNRFILAAAGAASFRSTGTLAKIHFQVASNSYYGQRAYINFQQLLFNEGKPSALTTDGGVTVFTPPLPPPLNSPPNGAAYVPAPVTLTFSWSSSAYAETYRLQIATDSMFHAIAFDESLLTSTSFETGPFAKNETYYWRANATNAYGTGAWSSVWGFTTPVSPPIAPMLVSPPNGSTDQPTSLVLQWNSSSGASSFRTQPGRLMPSNASQRAGVITYHVQLATDSDFVSGIALDSSAVVDTFISVSKLANNTTYYWRVSATNIAGIGGWSGVLNFMTISLAPAAPMLVSPPDRSAGQPTSLTLLWNSLPGATTHNLRAVAGQLSGKRYLEAAGITFHVQLASDSEFVIVLFDSSAIVDTSVAVSGLANNVTYYWHVNATNAGGTGPWSAAWRFATVLTGVGNDDLLPTEYKLAQNYPNPFNPTTNFGFRIVNCGFVSLKVYDVLGTEVASLVNEVKQPGEYTVVWDATKMPSGVYFYRLQAGSFIETKKLLLTK